MPIRVLQVVSNMSAGGIENYIMNIYRKIDRSKIQFDFLTHHSNRAFFDDEIEQMGGKIYRMSIADDLNIVKYKHSLKDFFAVHREYKIVHGHMASTAVFYLAEAEKSGVPVRIAHSHGSSYLHSPKGYAKKFLFKYAKEHATHRFACSTEAGRYLFKNDSFEIYRNAIDSSRFKFDADERAKVRNELNLRENFVIGHVGRFNAQKNHEFLIDIFRCIRERIPCAKLLLIGDGETKESIRRSVNSLGLMGSVIFLDVTQNVERFYQAMDVFILPSLFEGLPLTGIEAQCSGLPCIFADTISQEVKVTENAHFLPLSVKPGLWAEKAAEFYDGDFQRKDMRHEITEAGYDDCLNAKVLLKRYFELFETKAF